MIVVEDKEKGRNRYFDTEYEFICFVSDIADQQEGKFETTIRSMDQAIEYLKNECHYEYELKSKI